MVLDQKRAAIMPDVASAPEAGFPDMIAHLWAGVVAPVGTPREIIERLNREINVGLDNAELKANVAKLGIEVMGGTPSRLADRIEQETAVWRLVAEKARIRVE